MTLCAMNSIKKFRNYPNYPAEDTDDSVPKHSSVFRKFGFENRYREPGSNPVCQFLEKVQNIFIDEIKDAPVSESETGIRTGAMTFRVMTLRRMEESGAVLFRQLAFSSSAISSTV